MSDELKPCPFCGSGTTQFVENGRVWSGMKYTGPISVSVQHWCDPVPGQPSRGIERVGRDKASATTLWTKRADSDDLATLRATIPRLESERDEWRQAAEESQDRYARMMAMRDTCAAERNAEYAKVAVLRDALTEISKYPPIHPIATAVGQMARNALEQTQ